MPPRHSILSDMILMLITQGLTSTFGGAIASKHLRVRWSQALSHQFCFLYLMVCVKVGFCLPSYSLFTWMSMSCLLSYSQVVLDVTGAISLLVHLYKLMMLYCWLLVLLPYMSCLISVNPLLIAFAMVCAFSLFANGPVEDFCGLLVILQLSYLLLCI